MKTSIKYIGYIASTLSVLSFLPVLYIIVKKSPEAKHQNMTLFIITFIANVLWTYYGYKIQNIPVLLTGFFIALFTLMIIISLYFK